MSNNLLDSINAKVTLNRMEADLEVYTEKCQLALRDLSSDGVGEVVSSIYNCGDAMLIMYSSGRYSYFYIDENQLIPACLSIASTLSKYVAPLNYNTYMSMRIKLVEATAAKERDAKKNQLIVRLKNKYGVDIDPEDLS